MEILIFIGLLLLLVLLFVCGGLLGWLLKGIELIFNFLAQGCSNTMGCLFWLFVVFVLLVGLLL